MKVWLGRFWSGGGAIAFPGATLLAKDGSPVRTQCNWWPVRRVFGFGGRRFVVALLVVDAPKSIDLDPKDFHA
ncbi:hypothetical protein [Sphingomonas hankookensis]|uniref:hypothetical protein n=1 Tax=Sphingomonas hankookensis TaxID=563996 RepID=UPI003D303284